MTKHSSQNIRKAWLILILFVVFSATLGYLIGKLFDAGYFGAWIAFLISLLYAFFIYLFSDEILLHSLAAKRILRENNVHLYQRVHQLAKDAGVPEPELYYIDDSAINILSLGTVKGKIILSKGLMEKLSTSEIEAVFAHELIHIKSFDTVTGGYTAVVVGIFPFFSELLRRKSMLFLPLSLLLSLFSPLSAILIHSVISPKREYEADAAGVLVTRYPTGLIQALEKITQDPYSVRTAMQATAHLFIVNPFHGKANRNASPLFTTHPPIQERIKILQDM
jgi:heat shock protein HtpX